MGRRLALLVATWEYEDDKLSQLTAPSRDAEALATVLADPDIAGFEVTTLVNQPHYEVGPAIGEFYRDLRHDDLTLLYFSGHGVKDDDGRLYLAMKNTRHDNLLFTSLPADQVSQAMAECMSRQVVLVLDCCYSGAFPAGLTAKSDTEVHALERFQGRGRTVLTASDSTSYAFEGNRMKGESVQSVFTRHLVEGLRSGSADLDGDGDIAVDELYSYVHDRVVEEAPKQRPKKQDNVEGRTILARNVNWSLPVHLRNALASPLAAERLGALDELDRFYRIGNETVRAFARRGIERLADDDSKQVSQAATDRLSGTNTPIPAPEPRVEAPAAATIAPQVPPEDWHATVRTVKTAMLNWTTIINVTRPGENHTVVARLTRWRDSLEVDGETVVSTINGLSGTHVFPLSPDGRRHAMLLLQGTGFSKYVPSDLIIDGRRVPLESLDHEPNAES